MATQRYISTSFWEDEWVGELAWEEKYLYLYLLTNPRTTITGIYKAPIRMVAFETGLSRDRVEQILRTFAADGKAYYVKEHVVIPAWPRHQNWQRRPRIKTGIQQQLIGVPPEVLAFAYDHGYAFPEKLLLSPIQRCYSDSDSDLDSDLDSEGEKEAPPAEAPSSSGWEAEIGPVDNLPAARKGDELVKLYVELCSAQLPRTAWTDLQTQYQAARELAAKTRELAPDTPMEEAELARAVAEQFAKKKHEARTAKSDYWRDAECTPRRVLQRFPELVSALAGSFTREQQRAESEREGMDALARLRGEA